MKAFLHETYKLYMRSFPISKGKERILSRLWRPICFGDTHRQATLAHYPVNVMMNLDLTKYIQRHIYFYGGYEYEHTQFWLKRAGRANIIFDLGANVGLYSLLAAAQNPRAAVHAFEPTPELISQLQSNLALNHIRNVVVNPLAVGSINDKAYLHYSYGSDGSNEGMNYVAVASQTDTSVEMITLDAYCSKHQIDYIDLMKIDIEGGEFDALHGAEGLLRQHAIACIIIELVDWAAQRSGHTTQEIVRLFVSHGYQFFAVRHGQLQPIDQRLFVPNGNVAALLCC